MRVIFLLVLLVEFGYGQSTLNGRWWKKADDEIRKGAIDGIVDCLKWERGKELPSLSLSALKEKVNDFYRNGSLKKPIQEVLLNLSNIPKSSRTGGEDYSKEKHGIFDGQYWGSASVEQQNGFVEGYLSCIECSLSHSESAATIVAGVSRWYETHTSSSAWDKKVADIIQKVVQKKDAINPLIKVNYISQ